MGESKFPVEFDESINDAIDDMPFPIEYTGEDCNNCDRLRVEMWSDGKRVCEKCGWDQDAKEYTGRNIV